MFWPIRRLCDSYNYTKLANIDSSTHHRSGHAIVERILRRHDTNVDQALLPDAVARQKLFHLVNAHGERRDEVVDILKKTCGGEFRDVYIQTS